MALTSSCSNFEPVCCSMSVSNWCFLTCTQMSQDAGKLVLYSHLLKNFPQFVVIHTVKSFNVASEADIFLGFLCFFYDPTDVVNLISGSSSFSKSRLYIWNFSVHILWSLAWRIFSIILLSCEMIQLCDSWNILWHCPSLGLEWKMTFSRPVATAKFSKFAGILCEAL